MTDESVLGWGVYEMMGHRRLVGYGTDVEVAGTKLLRIAAVKPDGTEFVQLYGGGSIYCITPAESLDAAIQIAGWPWHTGPATPELTTGDDEDDDYCTVCEAAPCESAEKHVDEEVPY